MKKNIEKKIIKEARNKFRQFDIYCSLLEFGFSEYELLREVIKLCEDNARLSALLRSAREKGIIID
jgi:hypothetical protein